MPVSSFKVISAYMRPLTLKMEILANNLANINSVGYKKGDLFYEVLQNIQQVSGGGDEGGEPGANPSTTSTEYVDVSMQEISDFSQGSIEQTNNTFDIAIDGEGFFAAKNPVDGKVRYTRAGNFMINAGSSLVTKNGYEVVGDDDGPIYIPNVHNLKKEDITVTPTGEIMVEGDPVARLKVVTFETLEDLQRTGNTFFELASAEIEPMEVDIDKVQIRQGFLENSNVNGISEMIQMIEVSRLFETGQKLLQTTDATLNESLSVGNVQP